MPEGVKKLSKHSVRIFFLRRLTFLLGVMLISIVAVAQPQLADSIKNKNKSSQSVQSRPNLELYGFILTDVIYDFKQMDPKWYDVPRPTKLASYKDQFAPDGQVYFSARQTRFGVKSYVSTPFGPLNTLFEFDLLGSGGDAGQTTFHLRHAYGELGKFGVRPNLEPVCRYRCISQRS